MLKNAVAMLCALALLGGSTALAQGGGGGGGTGSKGLLPAPASLTLGGGSAAAVAPERKDLQIFRDISDQVTRYTQFTIFDTVDAEIANGRVILTGAVTMPYKKDDIERRVRKVEGIEVVENRIEVLPVSSFDDELRFRIARAIYGNSSFWNYAAMPNPPIHIVVNRGHVTLAGVVNSNVERMLARSLASGFGEFDVKNALRTDDEVRLELEKIRALMMGRVARVGRVGNYADFISHPTHQTHQTYQTHLTQQTDPTYLTDPTPDARNT